MIETCAPKIVAILIALSVMLGVAVGSLIGRRIERGHQIARSKRPPEPERVYEREERR